jgi:tRNA threonylcarbamoyl adenosine modification protein YeaZ
MMVLALEFSSPRRSVALVDLSASGEAPRLLAERSDQNTRSAPRPLVLINTALEEAKLDRRAVDALAIGLGPGSYTGIRSAIALAQGWQLARDIRIFGHSSVECMAAQAQSQGWFGRVHVAIDAQREEVYLATYEISSDRRQLREPLRLAPVDQLRALATSSPDLIVGPEVTNWISQGRLLFPTAETLSRLITPDQAAIPGEDLKPIYLRQTAFVKAPLPRIPPGADPAK